MVAQQVHLFLVEPLGLHARPGQEGADHEMQAGPVGAKGHHGQPDQRDIPAVARRNAHHQVVEQPGGNGKDKQKGELAADPFPVHENECQHAPDRDVIKAGVAQDALADGLAKDFQLFHEQNQYGQGGHRAGHTDAEDKLPSHGFLPDPAVDREHQPGRNAAQQQRGAQRQAGRNAAFAPIGPDFPEIEFDTGDHHKQHDGPPGDAVQRLDHRRIEDELVVLGKSPAENARPEQNAGDDLNDDERCVVIGLAQPPDQERHGENDCHGNQEDFGRVHVRRRRISQGRRSTKPMNRRVCIQVNSVLSRKYLKCETPPSSARK